MVTCIERGRRRFRDGKPGEVDISMTKPALFSQDDRILEGAGRQATAEVNRSFSRDNLELDEGMRLARELHDGVLQSLAGAALQLEAISRLIDIDPTAAQEHLRAVGEVIAVEQRELRRWIERLQPATSASIATGADLAAALEKLRERAEWQWRSEEHTSELQSHLNLVCRLLLEKKKKHRTQV